MKKYIPLLLCTLFAQSYASASTVTYQLDQSSVRGLSRDGVLSVTIDDAGTPGAINFHIDLLDDSLDATRGAGIRSIAFNGPQIGKQNIDGLNGWRISNKRAAGKTGKFNNVLTGRSGDGMPAISFSIINVANDRIDDYISPGKNGYLFSVNIAGIGNSISAKASWFTISANDLHPATLTPATQAVPVPPALWLLGSGLVGLAGMARRRNELSYANA